MQAILREGFNESDIEWAWWDGDGNWAQWTVRGDWRTRDCPQKAVLRRVATNDVVRTVYGRIHSLVAAPGYRWDIERDRSWNRETGP